MGRPNDHSPAGILAGIRIDLDSVMRRIPRPVPTGAVLPYAGASVPGGYLMLAPGATASRTEYEGLFAVIGTAYGVGDGSTTFGLPAPPSLGGMNSMIKT